MKHGAKKSQTALQEMLINKRKMTSLMERELALALNEVKRETANWVPMWVDWGHTVRSDCNTATAIRAITDKGELLWYVRHDQKKHGFHSLESDPFDAFADAMVAWKKRALVRAHWAQVKALSRDLMLGREEFRITMDDAEQSALCTLGIKWFRERLHIANKPDISGRFAGFLMKVEPQIGFIIYEAALRTGVWAKHSETNTGPASKPTVLTPGE